MDTYKNELLNILLASDNIDQAIVTAAEIIASLLTPHELPTEQVLVCLQANCQTVSSY